MAAEFLLNLRWHLGRVTHPYGLENTPEALARASAELAFHLGLAKRSQGLAHLTTLTSADLRPEARSLAEPGAAALTEGAGGNVFVLAAQVDHMRSRGALRPRQEEPVEMFTALIAGFQDGDDDEDEDENGGMDGNGGSGGNSGGGGKRGGEESDGNSEATFCFLSSGNSSALAARVVDWFERRFDCYVEVSRRSACSRRAGACCSRPAARSTPSARSRSRSRRPPRVSCAASTPSRSSCRSPPSLPPSSTAATPTRVPVAPPVPPQPAAAAIVAGAGTASTTA